MQHAAAGISTPRGVLWRRSEYYSLSRECVEWGRLVGSAWSVGGGGVRAESLGSAIQHMQPPLAQLRLGRCAQDEGCLTCMCS
jgi:hypothetical protein